VDTSPTQHGAADDHVPSRFRLVYTTTMHFLYTHQHRLDTIYKHRSPSTTNSRSPTHHHSIILSQSRTFSSRNFPSTQMTNYSTTCSKRHNFWSRVNLRNLKRTKWWQGQCIHFAQIYLLDLTAAKEIPFMIVSGTHLESGFEVK
jgi:hypothetical protein